MSRADGGREEVAEVRIDEWDRLVRVLARRAVRSGVEAEDVVQVVRVLARRAVRSGVEAEDVVQEVWVRIRGGACPLFLETPPNERSVYLWNVARRAAARLARDARRHEGEPIEAAAGVPCPLDGPAVVFERRELRERCVDLLKELRACVPKEDWRVFSLRGVEKKTWSAIAAEIGLGVDQVRYRFRSALKELRRIGRRRGFD